MKEKIIILKFLRIILHTILIGLFHVGCSVIDALHFYVYLVYYRT